MSSSITIALPRQGQPPLAFPQRCTGCGAEASVESTLAVTRFVINRATGEQEPFRFSCFVPHCDVCARATKATWLAQLLPFLAGFVTAGACAFAWTWGTVARAGLDEVGRPGQMYSLVVAAVAGLGVGLAGGLAAELAARVLFVPVFGRALLQAPLLAGTFFADADYVAGVRARPSADGTEVTFTFALDEIARDFASANAVRVVRR